MSENESYRLAEEYVIEQINDQLHDETTPAGSLVTVGDMQGCDCVPLFVVDGRSRFWNLWGVTRVHTGEVVATYKC